MNECTNCPCTFCANIPAKCRSYICSEAKAVEYSRKEQFVLHNKNVLIIESGLVIPCAVSERGSEVGLELMDSGLLGVGTLYSDIKTAFDIYVLRDMKGCIVPKEVIKEMCISNPAFLLSVTKQLSYHLSIATKRSSIVHGEKRENQIKAITELMETCLNKKYDLTHEEIALLIGMNRVTVSKIMANEKKKNTKVDYIEKF